MNTNIVQTFRVKGGKQKDEITVRCLPSLLNAVNTRISDIEPFLPGIIIKENKACHNPAIETHAKQDM